MISHVRVLARRNNIFLRAYIWVHIWEKKYEVWSIQNKLISFRTYNKVVYWLVRYVYTSSWVRAGCIRAPKKARTMHPSPNIRTIALQIRTIVLHPAPDTYIYASRSIWARSSVRVLRLKHTVRGRYELIFLCGFSDLGFTGLPYTWDNRQDDCRCLETTD
jgi:hypothetical protein